MAYVISCYLKGIPHAIQANEKEHKFYLIPLTSESHLGKVLSHPHKTGIITILNWIKANDPALSKHDLLIEDEQLFRK
jgi:hypothetical protein